MPIPISASTKTKTMGAARYECLAPLHSSMFGEILLCRDRTTQAKVVVKTVDLALALRQESQHYGPVQENVLQEIEVMTRVGAVGGHPNVIGMHDFFVVPEDNTLHVVLDYCEGGDLLDACSGSKTSLQDLASPSSKISISTVTSPIRSRLSEATTMQYTRDVIAGLCFLHRHGIAHRDLSLENILLRDGRAVIADFGLCAMFEASSSNNKAQYCADVVGKHYYMAPEVVNQQAYDPKKADVWSMGIVLFILLTASPPFEIAAMVDPSFRFMVTHGLRGILHAWDLGDVVSEATQDLLERMTAIDPDARPTVQQVLHHPALSPHLATEPTAPATATAMLSTLDGMVARSY